MPVEWTGSGPDLPLPIDRTSAEPLRDQLERALREAVRTGRLAGGERLPSSRVLAADLGLSRGLVTESYAQLRAEGYLVSSPGSATRVAVTAGPSRDRAVRTTDREPMRIDFRPAVPDLSSFPREEWGRAVRRACRQAPTEVLGYPDPYGTPVLREVLAAYLRRVRGAAANPDQTVVCAGYAQGLQLLLRALADDGVRTVAVEDPGDPDHYTIGKAVGLDVIAVPVDGQGIDVDALAATDARAVILTPAHQSPTGVVLTPQRRHAVVAWAAARDATIIEDDYDAEFRYDREPVGAVQGLAPDHVALLGSVSKSLAPALRLGWALTPPRLSAAVAAHKQLADRGSPAIDQLALAELLRSGTYDRHLRHMRRRYAARRGALVAALREHAPGVELLGLAAGFHAVAQLPPGADEQGIVAAARRRSVGLYGMDSYRMTSRTRPPQLVLGFGNLTTDAIHEGIRLVADLLQAA
ncbi:MocR-like pyridoxine biosynthesis transcription factor PdxR [Catellatospora citrea]|uniref:GntR family transcriptional regulator n=1 Tax=Catellatospora citrea TaxID=53366 RepID=A0A8J3K9L1_9ACTN|nr:PLP-dependent aminotransferase family protein [Catellatospora citrea]RKE12923.1 GntR family transcriptional regulator/MocR family aminotransferase [Catellatospora citrea]GIF95836.1 GntR family transcriptional regulator [Catellatospora citrea]